MNGFIFKVLTTMVLLSPTISLANSSNKTKVYQAAGCMACHQGESVQSDEATKKNQDDQSQDKTHPEQTD
jgi:CxxC motif-containing protein (DUF1111 family)